MPTQKGFAVEKGRRIEMKYPKILIYILLMLFLSGLPPIIAETPAAVNSKTENQEKDSKIELAEQWCRKGNTYCSIRKEDYMAAIECYRKAVQLNPFEIRYIIRMATAYRDDKKFNEAQKLLKEALIKFPQRKDRRKLHWELADVHYFWAGNLRRKRDYTGAITHYETAYTFGRFCWHRNTVLFLYDMAGVYSILDKKHKALEVYEKALHMADKSMKGNILNQIGVLHFRLGQNHKALETFRKAFMSYQAAGYWSGVAATQSNMGRVYSSLGRKREALRYYGSALIMYRKVGKWNEEARTLKNIAHVWEDLGNKQEALKYFEEALKIRRVVGEQARRGKPPDKIKVTVSTFFREKAFVHEEALPFDHSGNRSREANALNSAGGVSNALIDKRKALEYLKKSLSINQALGDRKEEARTLNEIGGVYVSLGHYQEALEYYAKSLSINQALGDRKGESSALNGIGLVYSSLGQKQEALGYYEKALSIDRSAGNRTGEATLLNNIGLVYSSLGQKQKALEYYEKALLINRSAGNRTGEATLLNNIGLVYFSLGQRQKALKYCEKALSVSRALDDLESEANTFENLMILWGISKKSRLAIFFGKQSVNFYQILRANISGLDKKLKRNYIISKKDAYRKLSDLLIIEGRLLEAQQVLGMLKEEEYFNFTREDRTAATALSGQVDYTEFENQWLEKYNNFMKKFSTIKNEYNLWKLKKDKNEYEKKRMEEFEREMKKISKQYEAFLTQLKDDFDKHEKEIKAGKIDPDTLAQQASVLQETLNYLDEKEGGRHAALHYLVYKGRISVILTTPSGQLVKQTEIDEKKFNEMVMAYRNFMMEAGRGIHRIKPPNNRETIIIKKIKSYEKDFYDFIFKTVDEELKKYGTTNMVVSLDGVLRYLPLGALWDGESYLFQRYRIAVVTPSSLKNIKDKPEKKKKILGLGASRGSQEFSPLPNVPAEIRFIVKDEENGYYGLIKGKAFIDEDFTKEIMIEQLKQVRYPLVHIASHFKFSPGDETKNHLLLGDGTTMKLSEIRRMGKLFDNVKLLVLSACQTGVGGNGEEIDGFGELAQQSGAKSVVASLWPVADESTKDLMLTFYAKLKEGKVTSKIEALRQAQLELAGLEDLLAKGKNKTHQSNRQKTEYSHPYYWGPFIMMGNWR